MHLKPFTWIISEKERKREKVCFKYVHEYIIYFIMIINRFDYMHIYIQDNKKKGREKVNR